PAYTGGVFVATTDLNGDGIDDILTTPQSGAQAFVKEWSGLDQSLLAGFLAFDPSFVGGTTIGADPLSLGSSFPPDPARGVPNLSFSRPQPNPTNSVMTLTAKPSAGANEPATFDTSRTYDFNIATTSLINPTPDIRYAARFGVPDAAGNQDVL